MKISTRIAALSLLALLCLAPSGQAQSASGFKVVVHPSNPSSELSRAELGRLFLKKTTLWSNGETVDPVDLAPDSPVREKFSRDVHGKEMRRVQSYWQRMIFSGRETPPPEVRTDAEVLAFVAANRNAIGYVSAAASTGRDVKVITVSD